MSTVRIKLTDELEAAIYLTNLLVDLVEPELERLRFDATVDYRNEEYVVRLSRRGMMLGCVVVTEDRLEEIRSGDAEKLDLLSVEVYGLARSLNERLA
jgi:hypothetical protein